MTVTRPAVLPTGGGEMGHLIRVHEWAATPLGPPEEWPQVLTTLVGLMLASSQPMFLVWGTGRTTLYNDGYRDILAGKHPALGEPFDRIWHEIWDSDVAPIVARAYAGEALHMDDMPLTIVRKGYPEKTHFSFSYTPVRDSAGVVQGFFCPCLEITGQVMEARRARLRAALTERLRTLRDPAELMYEAAALIGRHLGAEQAAYAEIDEAGDHAVITRDWNDGRMPSNAGRHRLEDFGPAFIADLEAGRTIAIGDVRTDPRTATPEALAAFERRGIRAFLNVPHRREGRLVWVLTVHSREPTRWDEADVALAEEVAERIDAAVQRARAEAALRESEVRSRRLVEGIAQAVWEADASGASPEDAQHWRAYTGQTLQEFRTDGWLGAVHPDDRELAGQAWREAVATGHDFDAEFRLRHADGGWRWTNARAVPLHDEGGRTLKWIGMNIDIDPRMKVEARLHEAEKVSRVALSRQVSERTAELERSRDLLQATMDASMDMIQVLEAVRDEAGEIVDFRWILNNHEAEAHLGDAIGKSLLESNPGVVEAGIFKALKRVVETGIPDRTELRYAHEQFDGWYCQSTVRLGDGVATTTSDITDRKRAEEEVLRLRDEIAREAVREGEARVAAILEHAPIGIGLLDADGRFVLKNPRLQEFVGDVVPSRDPEAVAHWSAVDEEGAPLPPENWPGARALRGETVSPGVDFCADPTGEELWVRVTAGPLPGHGAVLVLEDITQTKRAEGALRESEERKAMLLALNDTLRRLSDPVEIQGEACRIVGEWLGVERACYAAVDEAAGVGRVEQDFTRDGAASLAGEHRIAAFGTSVAILRRGESLAISDTQSSDLVPEPDRPAFADLDIIAFIGAPLVKEGELLGVLCVTAARPRVWTDGEVALIEEAGVRIWDAIERARAEAALRASETRFRALVNSSSNVVYRMSPDWVEMRQLDGRGLLPDSPEARTGWLDAYVPPGDHDMVKAAIREAIRGQTPFDLEHRVRRIDGGIGWLHSRAIPLVDDAGRLVEWFGAASDVTERKRAEEHQAMLMAELDHRVKNILAVVQSIARHTFRTVGEPGSDAAARLVGRLSALAHSHTLLASSRWKGASLSDLVARAVAPYRGEPGDRIVADGPGLQLRPKAAQTLMLAMHELVTNAAKHGALSRPEGRVRAEWHIDDDGRGRRLVFHWTESGGPPLDGPRGEKGFGSTLLERTLAFELGGEVTLDFTLEGLRAVIGVPLDRIEAEPGRASLPMPPAPAPAREAGARPALEGRRILLVEDEHLIADEMAKALRAAGCSLVGPAASLDEALRHAATDTLDAAILDINLGGEFVWPAARALRGRGVPFVFATGYAPTMEPPPDLAGAERIEKPAEPRGLVSALAALLAGR